MFKRVSERTADTVTWNTQTDPERQQERSTGVNRGRPGNSTPAVPLPRASLFKGDFPIAGQACWISSGGGVTQRGAPSLETRRQEGRWWPSGHRLSLRSRSCCTKTEFSESRKVSGETRTKERQGLREWALSRTGASFTDASFKGAKIKRAAENRSPFLPRREMILAFKI